MIKQGIILLGLAGGITLLLTWATTAVLGTAVFPTTTALPLMWLLSITAVTFITYGYDKQIAGSSRRRIPENSLLLLALCGGTLGALAAMAFFRHKTQKRPFQIKLFVVIIIQVALSLLFMFILNS